MKTTVESTNLFFYIYLSFISSVITAGTVINGSRWAYERYRGIRKARMIKGNICRFPFGVRTARKKKFYFENGFEDIFVVNFIDIFAEAFLYLDFRAGYWIRELSFLRKAFWSIDSEFMPSSMAFDREISSITS